MSTPTVNSYFASSDEKERKENFNRILITMLRSVFKNNSVRTAKK